MEPPPEAKHGAEEAVCDLISDDEEQPKKAQKDKGSKPEKTKKDKDAKPKTKKDKDAKPEKDKDKELKKPKASEKDKELKDKELKEPTASEKDKELKEPDPVTPLKLDCPSDGAEDGGMAKKQRTRTPQKKIADPKVREILQLHLDDHSTFSIGSYVLARC